jgi:chloride channel protein, CIC family
VFGYAVIPELWAPARFGSAGHKFRREFVLLTGLFHKIFVPGYTQVRMRRWAAKIKAGLEQLRGSDQLLLVLSLVIGALVGLVVVAFILLTGRLAARMYPAGGSGWRRILVPVFGSLSTGYLLWRYFPFARGSGIPQTKFAPFVTDGRIQIRTVLGKFFCCSASLASGIALGREGPSVQVGAGIASVVARNLGLSARQVKALVPVGCAAALAAAFNTPIAAVLFSLEEIMGDLHASVLGSVVLSSATSWMVLHLVLGDDPLFHVPGYQLAHPSEFGVYAVLGIVGGLGSVAFVKLLLRLRAWFATWPKSTVWFQPVVGGLTVGVMGYFVPEVMGVGYNHVDKVLNGDVVLRLVVLFAVLKILATAVCYASGNAGGIWAPPWAASHTVGSRSALRVPEPTR